MKLIRLRFMKNNNFRKNVVIGVIFSIIFQYLPVYLFNFSPMEYYYKVTTGTIIRKYNLDFIILSVLIAIILLYAHRNKKMKE